MALPVAAQVGWTGAVLAAALLTAGGVQRVRERWPGTPANTLGCLWMAVVAPPTAVVLWYFLAEVAPTIPHGGRLLWLLSAAGAFTWLRATGRLPRLRAGAVDPAVARCRQGGRDWLIKGLLPAAFTVRPPLWPLWPLGAPPKRSYLAVLAGAEGTGKSYLLTFVAVCLVLGRDVFGLPSRPLKAAVYADSELDALTFWQRVEALVAGLALTGSLPAGLTEAAALAVVRRRLRYVCLRDHGESLYVPNAEEAARGLRAAGIERIKREVQAHGAGLALVDGLTTGAGAAAGDGLAATRMMLALEQLGAATICIDHTNAQGGQAGSKDKARLERIKYLLSKRSGGLRLTVHKANFTATAGAIDYALTFHDGEAGELGPVTLLTPDAPDAELPTAPTAPSATGAPGKGVMRPGLAPDPADVPPPPAPIPLRPRLVVVPPMEEEDDDGGPVRHRGGERHRGDRRHQPHHQGDRGVVTPSPGDVTSAGGDAAARAGGRKIDAAVLDAVRAGTPADRHALADATGYTPQGCATALSRLRKAGALPRPDVRPTAILESPGARAEGAAG